MARRLSAWVVSLTVAIYPAEAAAQIGAELLVTGLRNPVAVVADPADRSVLYVVEQGGLVRLVRHGSLVEAPFLDLRAAVRSGGEQGLLGLALAPDHAESGRFFVNFTNTNGDTVVARFRRSSDPQRADASSRFDLMWPDGRRVIAQPFSNHNGGHLLFGRDGYLYVGLGDGGSAGDPMNHAQNPRSLLGKMLRLDVAVADTDARGYRVPEDNPFVDGDPIAALPEIWDIGLRNPWRYAFDDWTRGGTAALLIADVGQNAREEINFEPAGSGGRNYGWRLREGRQAFDSRTAAAFLPLTEPIHDYGRALGASITGGLIYRGPALDPSYTGRYFYADFVSGRVFSIGLHLNPDTGDATADDEQDHTARLGGRARLGMVSSFGTDHDGELLLVNYSDGAIVRIGPDFSVVPGAPTLEGRREDDRVELVWVPAPAGVAADSFSVERLREGAVVERQPFQRLTATLPSAAGDCFRVRALARSGPSGPASAQVCLP